MVIVVRSVLGLIALFFIVLGLRFVLTPESTAAEFFLTPLGAAGLSTVRGDLGGAFVAIGTFIVLGLRPGAAHWLHAAMLALIAVIIGRLVGFIVDGPAEPALLACTIEAAFIALLAIGARRLQQASG
jgi:hypothetical protein